MYLDLKYLDGGVYVGGGVYIGEVRDKTHLQQTLPSKNLGLNNPCA